MSLNTVGSQQKYGLIKKGGQKSVAAPVSRLKASSLFAKDELEDDEDEPTDIRKELVKRSVASEKKIDELAAKAMRDDPNIFDYDGAYDEMQAKKQDNISKKFAAVSSDAPKSRYIGNLQAASQMREKEQERIFERKLLKEREVEDKLYGDQPKYVTAAYKEKLMESKKWEYEDKIMEEVEKKHDVRSLGMQGFYAGLLTKNVAMGGDVKTHAISAYTAGSGRQEQVLENDINQKSQKQNLHSDPHLDHGRDKLHAVNDRRVIEDDNEMSSDNNRHSKRPRSPTIENLDEDKIRSVENTNAAASVSSIVNNKEEVVLSAKERYLARKKQALEVPSTSS